MPRPSPTRPAPAARPRPLGPWALRAVIALAIALPPLRWALAWLEQRIVSFPLDDAWIHLTYARTLLETGRWSYTPGAALSSGSTSPLFVLLEAGLLRVVPDEKLLGIGLGVLAHAAFVLVLARWFSRRLAGPGWVAFAMVALCASPQVSLLALSGMETSLFMLLVALAFERWSEGDALGAGLAVGLATWTRPEGLLLAGVLLVDGAIAGRWPRRVVPGAAIAVAMLAGYAWFNHALGGQWLPNTVRAKAALLRERPLGEFLSRDLMWVYGDGALLLLPLAAWAGVRSLAARRAGAPNVLAEAGWAIALPLACGLEMHTAHRFGRYLVPALPALAVCGAAGLQALEPKSRGGSSPVRWLVHATAAAVVLWQVAGFAQRAGEYAHFVRYHHDRHERTGRWLAEHTRPSAVVATHDVGAIAFYSRRRMVDLAGLVDPEVVPHLGRADFEDFLARWLPARGVTHLAVLENLIQVDNQRPVFEADPEPEILDVYEYRPGVTHFVPERARVLDDSATDLLTAGRVPEAEALLVRSLALDDRASTTWTLLGGARAARGDLPGAEAAFRSALARFPEQHDARSYLVTVLRRAGRADEARAAGDSLQ